MDCPSQQTPLFSLVYLAVLHAITYYTPREFHCFTKTCVYYQLFQEENEIDKGKDMRLLEHNHFFQSLLI